MAEAVFGPGGAAGQVVSDARGAQEARPPAKFLNVLPLRTGGHILNVQLLSRGCALLIVGTQLPKSTQSSSALAFFCAVGGVDVLAAVLSWYSLHFNDTVALKWGLYWRVLSLFFFLPYLFGYLLFDEAVAQKIPFWLTAMLILVAVAVEAVLVREKYKLMLYLMRINKFKKDLVNQFKEPTWLSGNPDRACVFFDLIPLTTAVAGYAVFTFLASIIGLILSAFFPTTAAIFGFYSENISETRALLSVVNFLGLIFPVWCLVGIQENRPEDVRGYLIYLALRVCVMVPSVLLNSIMANMCGAYGELKGSLGFTSPASGSAPIRSAGQVATEPPDDGVVNVSCGTKELSYFLVIAAVVAVHLYFFHLTYLLYFRLTNSELGKPRVKAQSYGTMDGQRIVTADMI
ncbi:unnamed protein product [Amoebophrya sp. A25]|nr:unnamed protein product [Amoebophrya sp. A25]|eukprot:GSA25T00022626001.1